MEVGLRWQAALHNYKENRKVRGRMGSATEPERKNLCGLFQNQSGGTFYPAQITAVSSLQLRSQTCMVTHWHPRITT